MMGNIEWLTVAEIPPVLKDGREVLLALPYRVPAQPKRWTFVVAAWNERILGGQWEIVHTGTYAEDADLDAEPEFFAEINPPLDPER